jgi:hypothetical protein
MYVLAGALSVASTETVSLLRIVYCRYGKSGDINLSDTYSPSYKLAKSKNIFVDTLLRPDLALDRNQDGDWFLLQSAFSLHMEVAMQPQYSAAPVLPVPDDQFTGTPLACCSIRMA